MTHEFLLLSLIAGLLAIDDRAGWQSLLAQPVFAALAIGLVTGAMQAALAVGVVLELIWLSLLPMRGLRRPDAIAGAVVGAGTSSLLTIVTVDPRFVFVAAVGVVAGLLAGEVGARLVSPLVALQGRWVSAVDLSVEKHWRDGARKLLWLHAASIVYIFVIEAVVVLFLLVIVFNLAAVFTRNVGDSIVEGVVRWQYLMPALGAASLIHIYWHQHSKRLLVLSAVIVIMVLWLR
jgi:mannose/fructose/N-acetylgalactosamine-specific phosphotransferase system component IIC